MAITYNEVVAYNSSNITYNGVIKGAAIIISGNGSLTILATTQRTTGAVAISGNGSVTPTVTTQRTAGTITISGNGSLVVVGVSNTPGVIAISGGGSVTVATHALIGAGAAWNIAIKEDTREFKYYTQIYFDGDSENAYGFDETSISGMTLLEETFAEGTTPLGSVSSNELTISFNNQDNDFSPRNTSSPYYGKLVPNVKVVPYIGIKVADDTYEYVNLGTFYTTNWSAITSSIIADVICHDYMYNVANKPMPQIPIQEDKNIGNMFNVLFNAMGISSDNYEIDDIAQSMLIAAFESGEDVKVRHSMQSLAERGLVNVFCDRTNKIKVMRNNNVESTPSFNWKDTDLIINSDIPSDYSNIFSQIELGYHIPYVGASSSVLSITGLTIPAGGITISKIEFSSIVGAVESVNLIGAVNSYIDSMTIGGRTISLVIENTGVDEVVDIKVIGLPVNTVDAIYEETDATAQAVVGDIKLPLDSEYMQRKTDAINYVSKILPLVTDPAAYIDIDSRGNPYITLDKSIDIDDATNDIMDFITSPIRMDYDFNSGCGCKCKGIKTSIRRAM